jgi:hypothetical protein
MPQPLADCPDLSADLTGNAGMGGVMEWMNRRGIPLSSAEIVQQDEFTLDFVLPLESDSRVLVFGIT